MGGWCNHSLVFSTGVYYALFLVDLRNEETVFSSLCLCAHVGPGFLHRPFVIQELPKTPQYNTSLELTEFSKTATLSYGSLQ